MKKALYSALALLLVALAVLPLGGCGESGYLDGTWTVTAEFNTSGGTMDIVGGPAGAGATLKIKGDSATLKASDGTTWQLSVEYVGTESARFMTTTSPVEIEDFQIALSGDNLVLTKITVNTYKKGSIELSK